jgi:hypothetical protein
VTTNPFVMQATGGRGGRASLSDRIAAYARRLPHLAEGQGRDDIAYHFAAFLVRDVAVSDEIALEWLTLWDAGNSPPKGRDRLIEIIRSAHSYGRRGYGSSPSAARRPQYGVWVIPTGRPGHYILHSRSKVD